MRSCKFLVSFCLIAVLVLCFVTVMPTVAFAGETDGVTPEDGDIPVTLPGASSPDDAVSASGKCGENLNWTLSIGGTLTIYGTGAMGNYTAPSSTPWAAYAGDITAVTVRSDNTDNVTSIGDNAFKNCYQLAVVVLSKNITSIGMNAFAYTALETITIPESITTIGMNAFSYTPLIDCTIPEGVTAIAQGTFKGCNQLTTIYIPSSVSHIESDAFYRCTKLQEVCIYGENAVNTVCEIAANGNDAFFNAPIKIMVDDGWYFISELNAWIYMKDYAPVTGWQLIDNKWYYFDETGIMQTGWLQSGNIWYYLHAGGNMATGWAKVDGVYYYFNSQGVMQTGWVQTGGVWYYMNSSGAMVTGWKQVGGVWYYFKSSGAMATGWAKVGSTWYYFKSSGAMATGWQKVGSTWYYFQSSGAMVTGWLKLGSTWYYFQSSGAMVTGSQRIGAKVYNFASSGACLNP